MPGGVTGEEAVDVVRRLRPDVTLMDIRMPVLDGIAAAEHIVTSTRDSNLRISLHLYNVEEDWTQSNDLAAEHAQPVPEGRGALRVLADQLDRA